MEVVHAKRHGEDQIVISVDVIKAHLTQMVVHVIVIVLVMKLVITMGVLIALSVLVVVLFALKQ
jgi:hypothetical protein